jgi:hypothetical protein
MATYATLQLNHFYLVIDNQGDDIELIQPCMETNKCVLITHHLDGEENNFWRRKKDNIFELIEELTDEQAMEYNNLFDDDDDDDFYDWANDYWDEDDDDEDDDYDWEEEHSDEN